MTEKLGAPDRILDGVPGTSKQRKRIRLTIPESFLARADEVISDETTQIHIAARRRSGSMATRGARAAARVPYWLCVCDLRARPVISFPLLH